MSHEFPPFIGGVGTVGAQLASDLVSRGIHVEVMTRTQTDRLSVPDVTFHDVDIVPKFWHRSYGRALGRLNLDDYDLVILNEAAPTIVAGKYFTEAQLKKCLVLLHGLEIENIYAWSIRNLARRLAGFTSAHARAVRGAGVTAAVSEDMRQKFLEACRIDPAPNIEVVYMGVDHQRFFTEDSNYRQINGFDTDDCLMVTGSRITREKGLADMLDAFNEMAARIPSLRWIICGDGDYLPQMKQEVETRGLSNLIRFEGYCDTHRLRHIYNSCDLFWLISHYREAFPLVYIEAQLTGLPVIGRDLGGVREAILPGNGWLVSNAADALTAVQDYVNGPRMHRDEVSGRAAIMQSRHTLQSLADRITHARL
ncbi:MAG: glycosyltransferase family 4 protein [Pseudomonadota bacterium]